MAIWPLLTPFLGTPYRGPSRVVGPRKAGSSQLGRSRSRTPRKRGVLSGTRTPQAGSSPVHGPLKRAFNEVGLRRPPAASPSLSTTLADSSWVLGSRLLMIIDDCERKSELARSFSNLQGLYRIRLLFDSFLTQPG